MVDETKNIKLPKVKFVFSAKKELVAIKIFVNKFGHKSFLPKGVLELLEHKQDKKIIEILERFYKKENIKRIEKEWRKIEKQYFESVEKVTGHRWAHKEYKVILTKYIIGFCSQFTPDANHVFVRQSTRGIAKNYITAHELFHSHYFKIVENKNECLGYTEYNENCAVLALLFTEVKKLFPDFDQKVVQSCIQSHPRAAKYFKQLLKVWKSRKNFEDYLKQSLKVVKTGDK